MADPYNEQPLLRVMGVWLVADHLWNVIIYLFIFMLIILITLHY